jgi:chromosome segregation ATPase
LQELEDSAGSFIKEKDVLEKEKADLANANTALKEELNKLQQAQKEIIRERDDIKSAYEKSNKDNTIKELKSEIARLGKEKDERISRLGKEKNTVETNLKQAEKELNQFKEHNLKLSQERDGLDAQLNEYKANYKKAEEKNKALEGEIKNMPKKFTELARQNKHLIRETAQMHYNLGVFYTRNKEYERAISEFEKVIEITPDDAYAHFNLGYIYAQYLVNRKKAIESFRLYLRLAKATDKDIDWAKKYLLTWETYEGKIPMQ